MKPILRRNKDLAALDGRRFSLDGAMTLLSFVLLLVIVVIPIFMIVYHAFFYQGQFDPRLFASQLLAPKTLASMWNTVKIAFWVTLFGTAMGVFYAWLLGRSDIPAKGLMRALFSIPYMFPPFLGAMAWDLLLNGRSGYLNRWLMHTFGLASAPFNINSVWGIVFVEISYYFPFVFMQVVSALERMDPTLEECARIAGARQMTVIRKITLPLVLPAISAGALLILISSLAHFGVPSILGVLSAGSYDIIKGKSMRPTLIKLRGSRVPLLLLAISTLIMIVVVPLVMIFLVGLVKAYGLPLIPKNFTLNNYVKVFAASGTFVSIKNSLFVSFTAGVVCMFLGTLIAYVVQKIRPRGRGALEVLSVLPYSIPGTVLAVGVILAWSGSLGGISLYNTIWIILVAYLARYLSFSMKSSSAALLQVHPSLEEAARACGASHTESLKDITLPLIRPAMVAGFFLIFLPAMREVTTSVLLYGPYTRTLGVQIYSLRDAGMMPQAAALGSVAIVLIVICNAIVSRITRDRKGV